jgi:branched-chain amino acid aminotransferase
MKDIVYLNGDLLPLSQAKISPLDHGFLYGYSLFETMRAYNGAIFLLERHLARLYKAVETLGMSHRLASHDLEKACYNVLNANELADARIRLTISAGKGDMIPNPDTCKGMTVFIAAQKLVILSPENYEKGFRAIISSSRRNSQSSISQLKTACYLENILARQEARAVGADEVVILNERGLVAEGSSSNIFLVNKQVLFSPSLECGALPGITREVVLELAQSLGIEAIEAEIESEKLLQSEEAFFTNSIVEIMPLTYIGDSPIGSGKAGVLTRRLMTAYKKLVADYQLKRTTS